MARNKQFPRAAQDFQNFMKIPSAVPQLSHAETDIEANRRKFAIFSFKIRKQSGAADVGNVSVCLLFVIPTYNTA